MYENITPESLKASMLVQFASAGWDVSEGSSADLLVGPMAMELWKRYMQDLAIPSMLFIDKTSGEYIEKAAAIYGLTRKDGTKASCTITFTGIAGTLIPTGTAFLTADELEYRLDAATLLNDQGQGSGTLVATQVGVDYNIGANEITHLFVSIAGLTSFSNEVATGGTDVESDEALVERYYKRIRTPGTSSNVHDYELWGLSVTGIGYVRVDPLWDGAGTVRVLLAGSDGKAVASETVADVVSVIEDPVTGRAVGAEVTVQSAQELTVNVSATLNIDAGADLAVIQQAVESSLAEYLESTIFSADTVLYNRILALILIVPGVVDVRALTVNGGTSNLSVTNLQIPVLGAIGLTEVS